MMVSFYTFVGDIATMYVSEEVGAWDEMAPDSINLLYIIYSA
jgi:hypothetical protein